MSACDKCRLQTCRLGDYDSCYHYQGPSLIAITINWLTQVSFMLTELLLWLTGVLFRITRSFPSPEDTNLLVSTKNRDLWPLPIFEHAQRTPSVVLSQSDLSDMNNESVNRRFLVLGAARGLDSWC